MLPYFQTYTVYLLIQSFSKASNTMTSGHMVNFGFWLFIPVHYGQNLGTNVLGNSSNLDVLNLEFRISNICFDFFKCACLHEENNNKYSKFDRWATKDISNKKYSSIQLAFLCMENLIIYIVDITYLRDKIKLLSVRLRIQWQAIMW